MKSISTRRDSSGVVNFNRADYSIGPQYRIRVYKKHPAPVPRALGYTPYALKDGREAECQIFILNIERIYRHFGANFLSEILDAVIAHEVGHAVGLSHHHSYPGNPTSPPVGEACVMHSNFGGFLTPRQFLEWFGTGYVDFHEHPGHSHWADHRKKHWETYKLHSRPVNKDNSHPSY